VKHATIGFFSKRNDVSTALRMTDDPVRLRNTASKMLNRPRRMRSAPGFMQNTETCPVIGEAPS